MEDTTTKQKLMFPVGGILERWRVGGEARGGALAHLLGDYWDDKKIIDNKSHHGLVGRQSANNHTATTNNIPCRGIDNVFHRLSANPFRRGSRGWGGLILHCHAAESANGTTMVVVFGLWLTALVSSQYVRFLR